MDRKSRRGLAIVVVLALSTALMIFGFYYLHTLRQQQPINPTILAFAQADILAQGIAQIAALKVKELPGPFYYSSLAATKGTATFLDAFQNDPLLFSMVDSPIIATYSTSYNIFPSRIYKEMNFKVSVAMQIQTRDGKIHSRMVEQTFNGFRERVQ